MKLNYLFYLIKNMLIRNKIIKILVYKKHNKNLEESK
jgi:hypothetical protein